MPLKTFSAASAPYNSASKEAPLVDASPQQTSMMAPAPEEHSERQAFSTPAIEQSIDSPIRRFGKRANENHLVRDLTEAVACGNFQISFQPIVSLRDGALTGAEACMQWKNRGKLVPALHFIPLAADYGLIDSLGVWMVRHAYARMRPVWARFRPNFRFTVNVLPLQLESGNLLQTIKEELGAANIRPENFEIEIADQMQGCNMPIIRNTVESLHQMGVSIALDEFGAGFSSIESLMRLQLNRIKVHESVPSATRAQWPILDGIVQMAKVLKIPIVATGINTVRQLQKVRSVGCDEVQGSIIAKSMSASELIHLAQARNIIMSNHPQISWQDTGSAQLGKL